MKNLRVLIEFNDCIIQANDFLTHQIISDDNSDRFQAYQKKIITEITKSKKVEVNGHKINKDIVYDDHGLIVE